MTQKQDIKANKKLNYLLSQITRTEKRAKGEGSQWEEGID